MIAMIGEIKAVTQVIETGRRHGSLVNGDLATVIRGQAVCGLLPESGIMFP